MKYNSYKLYTCGISWQHEIGHTDLKLYSSVADLKREEDHASLGGCGIVEVKVKFSKWIVKQDLNKMLKNSLTSEQMNAFRIKYYKKEIKSLQKRLSLLEKLTKRSK